MFLCVYLTCTASATRILTGPARLAAFPALLAVAAVLAFCGWALAAAAGVALLAALRAGGYRRSAVLASATTTPGRPGHSLAARTADGSGRDQRGHDEGSGGH